ncbi:hypothetical protein BCR43DRAFT_48472 [Syncephalastrum racemosum]|uniref:Uncharacterized protein n=1 Tax=Syncephalastrum racemosum TaxID=13706 RepID=A0A1X2HUY7_SYNRA|nr:hypothetical protein BCR43DRAFT_48472 [Syncephalastrum racemosum]
MRIYPVYVYISCLSFANFFFWRSSQKESYRTQDYAEKLCVSEWLAYARTQPLWNFLTIYLFDCGARCFETSVDDGNMRVDPLDLDNITVAHTWLYLIHIRVDFC